MKGNALTRRQRKELAWDAARRANQVRREARLEMYEPAPVFDIIDEFGIELRFVPIASLEGAYSRLLRPVILVSSLRPAGRQSYTAAHELGHHSYGHEAAIDTVSGGMGQEPNVNVDSAEFLAE